MSPGPPNIDADVLVSRFREMSKGNFDVDEPPPPALEELQGSVELSAAEVALLFGDELGLTWADVKQTPGRLWRRTVTLVRSAMCRDGEPQPWVSPATAAGWSAVTLEVLTVLSLPLTGGIPILIGIVVAGIGAQGVGAFCARAQTAT